MTGGTGEDENVRRIDIFYVYTVILKTMDLIPDYVARRDSLQKYYELREFSVD
jgi:hypothetical protein